MKLNNKQEARNTVKELCKDYKVTLASLEEKLGWTNGSISIILHPNRNLRVETFIKIVQAIDSGFTLDTRMYSADEYHVKICKGEKVVKDYLVDLR